MRRDGGWREDSTKAKEMTEKRRNRMKKMRKNESKRGSTEETSKTSHCFSMPDLFRD